MKVFNHLIYRGDKKQLPTSTHLNAQAGSALQDPLFSRHHWADVIMKVHKLVQHSNGMKGKCSFSSGINGESNPPLWDTFRCSEEMRIPI